MTNQEMLSLARELAPRITDHRRWLHAHAETGFSLPETTAYVRSTLEAMGYEVRSC